MMIDAHSENAFDRAMTEAGLWIARLEADDCTADDEVAFEKWLSEDSSHEQAFKELQNIWGDIGALGRAARQGGHSQAAQLAANEGPRPASRNWIRWGMAAAATILLAVASLPVVTEKIAPQNHYQTATGEQKIIKLADGSTADLNTDTKLSVDYTPSARIIRLDKGEALFNVAHDKTRPFTVYTEGGAITAVGTSFNVRNRHGKVSVTVLEGTIEVAKAAKSRRVTVGQTISYANTALSATRKASTQEIQRTEGWQKGRLVFDGMRLDDIVEEMNAYLPGHIVIMDEHLAGLEGGGVFKLGDADSAIGALERALPVKAVRITPYLTILIRSQDENS